MPAYFWLPWERQGYLWHENEKASSGDGTAFLFSDSSTMPTRTSAFPGAAWSALAPKERRTSFADADEGENEQALV